MAFFRTNGQTSYNVTDSNKIVQLYHPTAYTYGSGDGTNTANISLTHSEDDVPAGSGQQISGGGSCLWFSTDGTKLFVLYTDYEYYDIDRGYMKQFSLSTAWDLSTMNTTPTTTLTLPLGTRFPKYPTSGTALYSDEMHWKSLEFADDGLSFYFVRYESDEYDNSYAPGATRASIDVKCDYTLTTAWNLSTASLTSSTDIAISDIDYGDTDYTNGFVSMYHTMSGGELVICMGGIFMNLDSINDTTANFTSNLGVSRQWWWSEDETLLVNEGNYSGGCFSGTVEIDTNYVQSTSNELAHADGGTHVDITNESTTSQSLTYTWKYIGFTGTKPNVTYLGTNRQAGYTTPNITSTFSTDNYPPFTFSSGGGGAVITFEMTLISATVDTIDENNASRQITVTVL